jgi:hypothetical protein
MIIKLASFTPEEEEKLRKNLKTSGVKSSSVLTNYTHPGVILGGAVGGFAGSELGDKIFGGNANHEMFHITHAKPKAFWKKPEESIIRRIATPGPGFTSRLTKNIFRGTLGALGAGAGAYAVSKYREAKEKK